MGTEGVPSVASFFQNLLDDLSNSGRPFDYVVKAGQPVRQKVFPG
jgi:hypothetical protein